ncbi:DUF86 domain-containing protein [Kovacikia minuta CCNUW1]|nr:DUF86 domain-containing protein [Kovacikia minuta CCNUW1]
MRDVIVHEYDQVDLDVVWDVIQNKLPELLTDTCLGVKPD